MPGSMWRAIGGRIKSAVLFMLENGDSFLAMGVALGVIILIVVGHPSTELIDAAVLGLLGTVALAILRNREREDLSALHQLAGDAISDRPFQVVWQKNHWNLVSRDMVESKETELVRFTRNDVATIAHWSRGDGDVQDTKAKWRRQRNEDWIEARKLDSFPVARGGVKTIYCFDEEHNRGDMLEWSIERQVAGAFPTSHEAVRIRARTGADYPRILRVTWPHDSPPKSVQIRYEHQAGRVLEPKEKDGRRYVEEKVPQLGIGQAVEIGWNW